MGFKFDIKKFLKKQSQAAVTLPIESLRQNFKIAVQFLKKHLEKPKAFHQMPWYLLIGEKSAGKSQLMLHSGLSFFEQEQFTQMTPENMETQGGLNWWISPRSVLIDVPGYLLEEAESLTPSRAVWIELLKQIRQSRFHKPLNGILCVIDIESLPHHEHICRLKSRLTELGYHLKQTLPVYLVITKTDKIPGFLEYFDDLGKSEREACLGLTFPLSLKSHLAWTDVFSQQFDVFMIHLHQRALWRIHHEQDIDKRKAILNFPHQINCQKEALKKLVYELSTLSQHIFLRGCYFTSSLQKQDGPHRLDLIAQTAQNQLRIQPHAEIQHEKEKFLRERFFCHAEHQSSFFIPALLEQKIFSESYLSASTSNKMGGPWENALKWGAITLSGVVLLSLVSFFSQKYQQQTHLLNTAHTALSDYKLLNLAYMSQPQKPSSNNIKKLLPALNALSLASDSAKQASLPKLLQLQLHHKTSLANSTLALYHKALAEKLIPALRGLIETHLKNQDMTDNAQLYGCLKAYLMLGSPEHFDKNYLEAWFKNDFNQLEPDLSHDADFKKHLSILLANHSALPLLVIPDNTGLVAQVRGALNALPPKLLTQVVFKNTAIAQQSALPIILKNSVHSFDLPKSSSSLLFYQSPDINFLTAQINQALLEALKGGWVLGDKPQTLLTDNQIADLQKTLLNGYQEEQHSLQHDIFTQIKLKQFSSLKQLDLSLQELSSKDSPLIQLSETLKVASKKSPALNQALLNPIILDLKKLDAEIIQPLLNSTNMPASALIMAQNIAKQSPERILFDKLQADFNPLPEPFKHWLISITQQSQTLIYTQALHYSAQIWQNKLLPLCQKNIENHYPFVSNNYSSNAVSLKDFSRFFEKGGIFDQYFNIYLSPFVDTTQAKWQWKNINGLSFSQNTLFLSQFERANIIQSLFFNQNNQLDMPFSLTLKNQTLHYRWPIDTQSLSFNHHDIIAKGDWSIFSLLQSGKMISYQDKYQKGYHLILNRNMNDDDDNDESSQTIINILPHSSINPLLAISSGILGQFKCPSNLEEPLTKQND